MSRSMVAEALQVASQVDRAAPLVRAILEGTAPRGVRLAAARGALPLPRAALFRLLVALSGCEDEEIAREASACIRSWNEDEIQQMASDPVTDSAVLVFVLNRPESTASLLSTVLSNAATPIEALVEAARKFEGGRIDTILMN